MLSSLEVDDDELRVKNIPFSLDLCVYVSTCFCYCRTMLVKGISRRHTTTTGTSFSQCRNFGILLTWILTKISWNQLFNTTSALTFDNWFHEIFFNWDESHFLFFPHCDFLLCIRDYKDIREKIGSVYKQALVLLPY